ncbi:MAG: hypothetical protein OXC53_07045 [Rhodobacteraceae bacterium]|nr:hypothetical protein [Paracoccaceae bacterium]
MHKQLVPGRLRNFRLGVFVQNGLNGHHGPGAQRTLASRLQSHFAPTITMGEADLFGDIVRQSRSDDSSELAMTNQEESAQKLLTIDDMFICLDRSKKRCTHGGTGSALHMDSKEEIPAACRPPRHDKSWLVSSQDDRPINDESHMIHPKHKNSPVIKTVDTLIEHCEKVQP